MAQFLGRVTKQHLFLPHARAEHHKLIIGTDTEITGRPAGTQNRLCGNGLINTIHQIVFINVPLVTLLKNDSQNYNSM